MKVIIQKVNVHVNPDLTSAEQFEKDQSRLEAFCEQNGITVVDEVRKLNEICDRIAFNANMKKLTLKLPADIRSKF